MASSDAHYVFFYCLGWILDHFDFAFTAILGRALGLLLLAYAWVTLGMRLVGQSRSILLSLLLFLCLNQIGTLSGEWIVGGIEGKVPAWAFGLLAMRFAIDRRWVGFGGNVGLSVSFHPVVGAWVTLAVICSEAGQLIFTGNPAWSGGKMKQLMLGAVLAGVLASPGLIPALAVLRPPDEVPAELRSEVRDVQHMQAKANYIQVFGRLKHHLDPVDFPPYRWIQYGLMLAVWIALLRFQPLANTSRLWPIMAAATLFALLAVWIGYGPRPASQMPGYAWKASVLKLYPFRFVDALLPMVLALHVGSVIYETLKNNANRTRIATALMCVLTFAAPAWSWLSQPPQAAPDWLDVCDWCATNTDEQTLYITPREARDFKWYAQRAEWVNYKDCPQDAAGIVEWNRRLWRMREWRVASIADGSYSANDLRQLAELSSAEYLITQRIQPIEAEPVYRNATYRIYRLLENP
jgi:hypothetical protein